MIDIDIVCSWLFSHGFKHVADLELAELDDLPAWAEIPPRIASVLLQLSAGSLPSEESRNE